MSDNTGVIGALRALLEVGLGAGLLITEPNKPKTKPKAPVKQKPAKEVETEEIKKGEYLPKSPPVSTEEGFSRDAWVKMQNSKQRKMKGWGE